MRATNIDNILMEISLFYSKSRTLKKNTILVFEYSVERWSQGTDQNLMCKLCVAQQFQPENGNPAQAHPNYSKSYFDSLFIHNHCLLFKTSFIFTFICWSIDVLANVVHLHVYVWKLGCLCYESNANIDFYFRCWKWRNTRNWKHQHSPRRFQSILSNKNLSTFCKWN